MNRTEKRSSNFEQLGHDVARETRNLEKAKEICGYKLAALNAELQAEIEKHETAVVRKKQHHAALCEQLYGGEEPMDDKTMLNRKVVLRILISILVAVLISSVLAHAYRFMLLGRSTPTSLAVGLFLTIAVTGAGYFAFEKLLAMPRWVVAVCTVAIASLMLWGVFRLAQAGGIAMSAPQTAEADQVQSYVDGDATTPDPKPQVQGSSDETKVKDLVSSAVTWIFVSADLMLGFVLAVIIRLRTDPKYGAWIHLHKLEREIADLEARIAALVAIFEVAQRDCMAGILRYMNTYRKAVSPYFKGGTAAILLLLAAVAARAQGPVRQEAILIDASASIAAGGSNSDLFHQYIEAAAKLIATEPPNSRLVVFLITSDSFGTSRELLRGNTPDSRGIFVDELNRARHQLASAFESRSAAARPVAAGTDITGALWRVKTSLESGPTGQEREIWIFSDMVNDTPSFPIPALLASGSDEMLQTAKANGLVVPLQGYKVHILGAATRGLSPQSWNTIKSFWTRYCQISGADLVSYAPDVTPTR